MGQRLRALVGVIKDKASLAIAALTSPPPTTNSSTSRSSTPRPALLSFGSSSRLSLVSALASCLSSNRDPCVALKSLLSLHHILSDASFILLDSVYASFLPSSGRRSPLNLSSFASSSSLPLSLTHKHSDDTLSYLSNKDLLSELDVLIAAAEEISRVPPMLTLERNLLALEVVKMVERERPGVVRGIAVRVREAKERLGELGFADSVELVCLVRRLEECRRKLDDDDSLMGEMKELRERVGEAAAEERGRVRREKMGESARILDWRSK